MHLDADEIEQTTFPLARRGYDPKFVDPFLKAVAGQVRSSDRQAAEAVESAAAAQAAAAEAEAEVASSSHLSFEKIARQVATILSSAAEAAEQLKANAEEEAAALQLAAGEQAAEIVGAASEEAALMKETAANLVAETEAVRLAAEQHAAALERQARDRGESIERVAQIEATKFEKAVHTKVDAFLEDARARYARLREAEQRCAKGLAVVESLARRARAEIPEHERAPRDDLPDDGYDPVPDSFIDAVAFNELNRPPARASDGRRTAKPAARAARRPRSGPSGQTL